MVNTQQLADMMLSLQKQNAANINLVTPTHYLPRILEALKLAIGGGLDIPIVYNSSGYELTEIIKLLFGIVDVYLPDLKYIDSALAKNCSNAADRLIAGTVIRHMVLPDNLENSRQVLTWIKENLDDVLVSVMFQYQPYFRAKEYQPINRKINQDEYNQIKQLVEELEINGWVQEFIPNESLAGVHFKKESNPPHE
jgi:putative pyruvate formate lyase activating enzyme